MLVDIYRRSEIVCLSARYCVRVCVRTADVCPRQSGDATATLWRAVCDEPAAAKMRAQLLTRRITHCRHLETKKQQIVYTLY
jgi:hypothetical protein